MGESGDGPMKGAVGGGGGGSSYTLPGKRRWKGLVIGVLGLVLLSMLVPLVFLLGLHNSFQSHSGNFPPRLILLLLVQWCMLFFFLLCVYNKLINLRR